MVPEFFVHVAVFKSWAPQLPASWNPELQTFADRLMDALPQIDGQDRGQKSGGLQGYRRRRAGASEEPGVSAVALTASEVLTVGVCKK